MPSSSVFGSDLETNSLLALLKSSVFSTENLLISILHLSHIPVITKASYTINAFFSSCVNSYWRRPHMSMNPITSGISQILVLGSQTRNPNELVFLIDKFWQKQEAW